MTRSAPVLSVDSICRGGMDWTSTNGSGGVNVARKGAIHSLIAVVAADITRR